MNRCGCVKDHSPVCRATHVHHILPLGMGGKDEPDNVVTVCPNTHANAHQLLRLTGYRYDGATPFRIRREFSRMAQTLAYDGWHAWDAAGRPVDRHRWIYQGTKVAIDGVFYLKLLELSAEADRYREAARLARDVLADALDRTEPS